MSKIKYEDVKDAASFHGWELITKEYTNLQTEMEFKCPEGHIVNSSWKKVRENFLCPICEQAKKQYGAVEIKSKTKGSTRVLALDQATNVSGWSIYDNKQLVAYGKIEFTVNSRVKPLDIELLYKLKEAGCFMIAVGFESSNDETLKKIKKGVTREDNIRAAKLIKKSKLPLFGFFMIGFPWETKEDIIQKYEK